MQSRFLFDARLLSCVCILFLTSCSTAYNYSEQEMPKSEAVFAETQPPSSETLKVVSFNVQYGNNIDEVIHEFQHRPRLQDTDILLLQEMDEVGTRRIAEALRLNYVYYAAIVHPHNDKNFGNAILARWPISDGGKILLPYQHPFNKQQRIAVFATVTANDLPIIIYNIHIEVPLLSSAKRREQIEAALRHSAQQPQIAHSIIGGDLNAVGSDIKNSFASLFRQYGFEWVTAGIKPTSKFFMQLDHLYVKGMTLVEVGTESEINIGDHHPIWAIVTPRVGYVGSP